MPDDKYTSVLTAIIGKVGKLREERKEKISWGGTCPKIEVPVMDLNVPPVHQRQNGKKALREKNKRTGYSIQMAARTKNEK